MLRLTRLSPQSILSPVPRRCAIVGLAVCFSLALGVLQSEAASITWPLPAESSRMFGSFGSLSFSPTGAFSGASTIGTLPRALVGNGGGPTAFDPATGTVYVANMGDTLSVLDARTCNGRDHAGCEPTPTSGAPGDMPFAIAIDDKTNTIYVTNAFDQNGNPDDTVSVINAATCSAADTSGCGHPVATVTVGLTPFGIAVDPATDTAYVANVGLNGGGDTVSVIDGATCNATNTSGCGHTPAIVTVGQAPYGVAVDPVNKTVYVTDGADNAVSMIDARTCRAGNTSGCGQTPPTVTVGNTPTAIAIDRKSNTVYVGNDDDATVSLINGAICNARDTSGCGHTPDTFRTPGAPGGLAVNQDTDALFVSNQGSGLFAVGNNSPARGNTVSVIDAAQCNANDNSGCDRPTPLALTGAIPGAAAIDEASNTAYVATNDGTLTVIDGATCTAALRTGCGQPIPATFAVGSFSAAIDQATHTVYVGGGQDFGGPSTIAVLDTSTCNTTVTSGCKTNPTTIPMQLDPMGMAVDQATDTIYAAGFQDGNGNPGNTVSVINGATCNASMTIGCATAPATGPVGNRPAGVGVNQATNTVYVANLGDNTLSVINGKTCNASNTTGCSHTPPTVPLGSSPVGVAVNQATDTIYVLNPGTPSTVSVINGATCNGTVTSGCGSLPPTVTVGDGTPVLAGLAVNEATNTIYVVNTADNTVSVINGATCNGHDASGCGQTPAHVRVGRMFAGFVAVDQAIDLVYVSDANDDTVSIIDGANCNGTVISGCDESPPTVPAGARPAGLAVDLDDHTVFIADADGGTASFFKFQKPGRPTAVTATAGRGQVKLAWQAPYDGGLPIIYHVMPSPSCPACTGLTTPPTSGIPATTISGVPRGQAYTFKVAAAGAAGTGPTSAPSNPVTP
jgi:DNA-binding beta-propeller fold protein YncE